MSIQASLNVHKFNPQELSESFCKHKVTISVLSDSLET